MATVAQFRKRFDESRCCWRDDAAARAKLRLRSNVPALKKRLKRYARQQTKQRADERTALRGTGSKIASAVSGFERGLKPIAENYLP